MGVVVGGTGGALLCCCLALAIVLHYRSTKPPPPLPRSPRPKISPDGKVITRRPVTDHEATTVGGRGDTGRGHSTRETTQWDIESAPHWYDVDED